MSDSEGINPCKDSLSTTTLERGFDHEAYKRILFRMNFIEKGVLDLAERAKNGEAISTDEALILFLRSFLDLNDSCREMLTLLAVSLQQEQGVAPPPNVAATTTEAPSSP